MTEDQARDWVIARYGSHGIAVMEQLVSLLELEASRQNLIAPSTFPAIWSRHIVDSAQLIDLAPTARGRWVDIGSGAGFPGLVVAALSDYQVCLVEPRRRRAEFLDRAAQALDIRERVDIRCQRVETIAVSAAVISARAVAPLDAIFGWGLSSADIATHWILPKGRGAAEEVARAERAWHGVFHVEQSITDPESLIVIASGVERR